MSAYTSSKHARASHYIAVIFYFMWLIPSGCYADSVFAVLKLLSEL